MKKSILILLLFIGVCISNNAQKVVFLHHSTGGAVYSEGNVAAWISNYNSTHNKNYEVTERGYPDSPYPWDNYPYDFWNLWVNPATTCNIGQPGKECISTLTQNYKVIIFKHCFPGAGIVADEATSSVSSSVKTLTNYKLQYRALRAMMDGYPNNIFIVWTLAPLHRLATNTADAARAKQFVDWVKTEWLTEDGNKHPNIYIFDFWGIVAELNLSPTQGKVNCLKYEYEDSHTGNDSHPNTAANQVAGPLFGQCIVNAIENTTNLAPEITKDNNPQVSYISDIGKIIVDIKERSFIGSQFTLVDRSGRVIFSKTIERNVFYIDAQSLTSGVYLYSIFNTSTKFSGKMVVSKK